MTAFFVMQEVKEISNITKSPISYVGGKRALSEIIIQSLPLGCDRYVEVFGGGASVLLAKPIDRFEVYNDLNADLVNMFVCIRDKPLSFFRTAGFFPLNSRTEFRLLQNFLQKKQLDTDLLLQEESVAREVLDREDWEQTCRILQDRANLYDVERAAAFYKMMRYSYGGGGKSYGGRPTNLSGALLDIYAVAERMRNVVIEDKDFEELIKQHDRPTTMFYLDPPYFQAEGFYTGGFDTMDHLRLSECLHQIQGKFVLSYNNCSFVRDLYDDFCIVALSRLHSLAQRYSPGKQYEELMITNFDVNERRKSLPQQLNLFGDEEYARDLLQDYRQKGQNHYTVLYEKCLGDKEQHAAALHPERETGVGYPDA